MQDILAGSIPIILWLQQFSPALDAPFKAITFFGEVDFFLLFLPLFYWCLNRRLGARMSILIPLSGYIGAVLKVALNQPRPFEFDPRVRAIVSVTDRGFPSLHTQNTVVTWGYLGAAFRRTWLWIVAGLLMVLVPLSRLYLGVHFPTDLLGGYVIGAALLLLFLRLEPAAEAWLGERGFAWQLGAALVLPGLLLFFLPGGDETAVVSGAMLIGASVGFVLERRWVGFETDGAAWQRALRLLLGAVVLFGLRLGLKAAFASLQPELVFNFVRYILIGLWYGVGAPWAFVHLGLAQSNRPSPLPLPQIGRGSSLPPGGRD
jgi:membrane-associated phospholipid phosphatase